MADDEGSHSQNQDEGHHSHSYSQEGEGEFYSDEDRSHSGSQSYYDDEDRSHSGSRSYYSDEYGSHSGSQRYHDEEEHSQGEASHHSEDRSHSQSYHDDEEASYVSRSHSEYEEEEGPNEEEKDFDESYVTEDIDASDRSNSQSYSERSHSQSQSHNDDYEGSFSGGSPYDDSQRSFSQSHGDYEGSFSERNRYDDSQGSFSQSQSHGNYDESFSEKSPYDGSRRSPSQSHDDFEGSKRDRYDDSQQSFSQSQSHGDYNESFSERSPYDGSERGPSQSRSHDDFEGSFSRGDGYDDSQQSFSQSQSHGNYDGSASERSPYDDSQRSPSQSQSHDDYEGSFSGGSPYSQQQSPSRSHSHYDDDEGSFSQKSPYDDPQRSPSRSRSHYDDDEGSFSQKSPYDDSQRSPSRSHSHYDDDDGSISQKSPYDDSQRSPSRSHSHYDEDEESFSQKSPYDDSQRSPSQSHSRYDEDEGSFSQKSPYDDSQRSPSQSRPHNDDYDGSFSQKSPYGSSRRSPSQSRSHNDDYDGSLSQKSPYDDSQRTPSQSQSYEDEQSGSYESGQENELMPGSPTRAYGYEGDIVTESQTTTEGNLSSFNSSTPSFALDSGAEESVSSHASPGQKSFEVDLSPKNLYRGPESKAERKLPYHQNMAPQDFALDSSGSGSGASFAADDAASVPSAAEDKLHASPPVSPAKSLQDSFTAKFQQSPGRRSLMASSPSEPSLQDSFTRTFQPSENSLDRENYDSYEKDALLELHESESTMGQSQSSAILQESESTMKSEASSINSEAREANVPGESLLDEEEYESEEEDEEEDSFFDRSLLASEPDQLQRITEHTERGSEFSSHQRGNNAGETLNQSVKSFESEQSESVVSRSNSIQQGDAEPETPARGVSPTPRKRLPALVTSLNHYTREQMKKLTMEPQQTPRRAGGDGKLENQSVKNPGSPAKSKKGKGKKHRRHKKIQVKSEALLTLVASVNDAMIDLEGEGEGEGEEKRSDWAETKEVDMDSAARRLLHGFEALVGILLQFSDELELMCTFARKKDAAAIESLETLLSFAPILDDEFVQLKPVLLHYVEAEIDEEMNDFLFGMNLIVDLLCELTHRIGEKQTWNPRAHTAYATLLELLSRDTLEVTCIFDDVDTPEYELTQNIEDAWAGTGHEEEFKALQAASDLAMFRQICYDVMLSTDQWCPEINTLMDICGIDQTMLEEPRESPSSEEGMAEVPETALQVLEKINGDPLPRVSTVSRILRRILPSHALTDTRLLTSIGMIKREFRDPLGLPSSNLIAISSVPEVLNEPEASGVAGVGKTTLAAMVAHHPDVRRFFGDGIAWIHVGQKEMNYSTYVQCLRDLASQLHFEEDEEPLFPELLHSPGESMAKRRRREEGFMLYVREMMVDLLQFRNILIILDDVRYEPDLDWFDFDPAALQTEETEEEFSCVILVTTRCRNMLPAADTVEVDMLDEEEAIELLVKESGELSESLEAESAETGAVVLECANHPLAVKSVGRWLNLKHATAGVVNSAEEIHEDVVKSMEKILKSGKQEDADMMYEILGMSLSPAINGEPTNIIKFCFAAFVRVFCDQKHLSDFALADATPIVPLAIAELLFEALLDLEEESLLQEGSLFYAQKKEAAVLIPEALSALGVLKVIITYAEDGSQSKEQTEEGSKTKGSEEKYLQVMHSIQEEYGEYICREEPSLADLTKDAEQRWNRAFAQAYLEAEIEWDTDSPNAALDYALEMMPCHMIRGAMFTEAADLLANSRFVRGRLFALGRESGTRRHIKDCETLFDALIEQRSEGRRKVKMDPKATMKQAYQTLGGLLNMDEDDYIAEEGSPEALEVGRSQFEIGFSLAEKRCWDAAIAHWETSQELLVSSLGMVEVVAGIQYNVGVVYAKMNEYEKALDSLKQCLRIRGAIHGEEHILYAQTIQKIGDVFLAMSDYHEAIESYNWALDVMHIEPSQHRIDIGDILENMGDIHYSKGEIEDALQNYQDSLRSKQVDLGEEHPELASSFQHIGNCLSDQGKTEEAIAHFEEAIRLKKMDPDESGERDADVLTMEGVLHNLNGRQQEGLGCYEKALQILVTKVPHKKEKVASLLHLIGCVYLMSGEHKKAMKLFEESLQARRKVLGFVHLDVASTLFNMAFLHQTRNRLDRALKCLEEALKIRQLRLPDSEKVAITHEKIGTLARSIGKTKKAEIAFEEALRIRKLIHSDKHEAVAAVLQELGDLMDDLGESDEAMRHYVEALDIRQTRLGPDDLAVAETLYSMGFSLQNNGAPDRALQCYEESLSIRQFQLGEDAKEVGDTLNMMGYLQAQRSELDEALSLLWDALRIRKAQNDNIKVSETLKNIGNVHREKQEYDLAIECYEECLRIRRVELGEDHEKVADALIAIGNVQSDMESTDDAMRSYEEALRVRTTLYGDQDDSVAAVLQYMGTLEFRAEKLERAQQLLNEFLRIRDENGSKNDGDYVNVLFMVGNIHKMRGNEEEAQRCWTDAYKIFRDLGLADGNPQIAELMGNLVTDEQAEEQMPAEESFEDHRGIMEASKGVLGRLSKKVKSSTKIVKGRGHGHGQQL